MVRPSVALLSPPAEREMRCFCSIIAWALTGRSRVLYSHFLFASFAEARGGGDFVLSVPKGEPSPPLHSPPNQSPAPAVLSRQRARGGAASRLSHLHAGLSTRPLGADTLPDATSLSASAERHRRRESRSTGTRGGRSGSPSRTTAGRRPDTRGLGTLGLQPRCGARGGETPPHEDRRTNLPDTHAPCVGAADSVAYILPLFLIAFAPVSPRAGPRRGAAELLLGGDAQVLIPSFL